MHARQLRFAIPGLGGPRLSARPGAAPAWIRPRLRLPGLGPRALAGLTACLLVLVPGLLAAESVASAVRWARALAYGAATLGALVVTMLGVQVARWQSAQVQALATRVRAIPSTSPPPRTGEDVGVADVRAAQRLGAVGIEGPYGRVEGAPHDRLWADLSLAIDETARTVARDAAEQRVRAARLEAVLGSLAEGVIVADEQRHVIFANPVARQLLHLPADDPDQTFDGSTAAHSPPGDTIQDASQRVISSYSAPVLGEAGSGLGLAIVRSLAELHGGLVQVTPPARGSAARGARFVVDLPRAPDDAG